ncbi:MAG: hypothetical protein J5374_05505 [Bacteroidales bacterium]|jgi:hypothetical protein|nr:hypothetical protein [Bacteroidales bacterium]
MENKNKDIIDDEFRVLGTGSSVPTGDSDEDRRRKRLGGWVALAIVALLGLGMILFWPKERVQEDEIGVFESEYESETPTVLGTDDAPQPYAEQLDTVVAGHPLKLFIPHHATPRLRVGQPNEKTLQAVMGFQAADIRADNYEILGDFVLAGEQMTKGSSKAGFCAIVDGKATVGVSRNTPLLVEAVARGGYFFRQYPLVDNGTPVENKPKNKTVRKALCSRGGQVFVAFSGLEETLTDFARVLADFGIDNAIYLVGSEASFGWAVDSDGYRERFGNIDLRPEYKNENYIIWD